MAGLAELLSDRWVIKPDEAEQLNESGRASIRVAVLSSLIPFGAEDMDRYPNLALIVAVGAGAERIDAEAAAARGIPIRTGAGGNAEDVADIGLGLFVGAARRMQAQDTRIRQDDWRFSDYRFVPSLSTYKVGVMGMGAIGRAIARRLEPLRCQIAWTGPKPKADVSYPYFPTLPALADWANALIVTAPLTDDTAGSVNRQIFDALGPGGVIVNVGRGPIINEDDLIAALKDKRLHGAGLDVFAQEPTPAERWRDVPNVFLSPHTGGLTPEAFAGIVRRAADHVAAFLD
jgi:lactate dehydrogenase-like 2-hydroxyacid dehydrogenase